MIWIREIKPSDALMPLLLLADPNEGRVMDYLNSSVLLIAELEGAIVGVLVLASHAEIMNIAVLPECRRRGVGSALVIFAIDCVRELGFAQLTVGTGNSSIGQLEFYQRLGFRISSVTPNYFSEYDPPIYENGIRCIDKVHLLRVQ